MLYNISNNFPEDLYYDKERPFISLYQPTHRSFPDNKKDPIVFKNLLTAIKASLEKLNDFDDTEKILAPFMTLKEMMTFGITLVRAWQYLLHSISVLSIGWIHL